MHSCKGKEIIADNGHLELILPTLINEGDDIMAVTYTQYYNLGKQLDTSDKFLMSVITDNMDIIDTTMKSISDALDVAKLGIKYKGEVYYYSDLPSTGNQIGDAYTVKYSGTSGTTPDGTEYVWGTVSGTNQWIDFSKDSYTKAEVDALLALKQNALTTAQLAAVNSGIDSTKVAQIETNKNNILSIQDHYRYDDRQLYLQEAIPTENITVGSTWIDKKTISSYTDSTNIVGGVIEQGSWMINKLIKENTNLRCRLSNSITVQPSTTYTITLDSPTINDARVLLQYRDINDYVVAESGWQATLPYTFTTPANCRKATIIFSNSANSNCVPSDFGNLQINKGSTAQSYASPAWS